MKRMLGEASEESIDVVRPFRGIHGAAFAGAIASVVSFYPASRGRPKAETPPVHARLILAVVAGAAGESFRGHLHAAVRNVLLVPLESGRHEPAHE